MSPLHVAIGELGSISGGGTPSKANHDYYTGKIPWVTPKDMKSWEIWDAQDKITGAAIRESATTLIPAGSILVVNRSGILKHTVPVAINRVPVAINQDLKAITCHPNIAPEYLARMIKAAEPIILSWVRATTADNFSIDNLKRLTIPLPSIDEQRRIAAILDAAYALRQKRRQGLALIDQLVQSHFIELFGDPTTNPKKWALTTIGELLESASYGTSAKAGTDGSMPVLRMNNLTYDGKIDIKDLKFLDLEGDEVDRYTVRSGDILFNRTNSPDLVGKTAVYRGEGPMAYAGYLVRLRTNRDALPDYISGFLNSRYGKAVLRGMCKSIIGMANINATEVQTIKIPKPPIEMQLEFAKRLKAIEKTRRAYEESESKLAALFGSLQQRAFSGEL